MTFSTLKSLWLLSLKISQEDNFLAKWIFTIKFFINAIRYHKDLAPILDAADGSAMKNLLDDRKEITGVVLWPFICSDWDAPKRIQQIASHCATIDRLGAPFTYGVKQRVVLLNMNNTIEGLRIIMDEPIWFLREGQLVINIFFNNFRAYSLAFSFDTNKDGKIDVIIGAIQGRNTDDILDTYRVFTKAMHGIRPRDFLIEVAKMVFRQINVSRILAVSDFSRVHRHSFFGSKAENLLSVNYDEVWQDRGAKRYDRSFWQLPVESTRKDLAEIKSKKRSLYKKRFALLDEVEADIGKHLKLAKPTWFQDE